MKVLFAVSNEEISEKIVKKYQQQYKEIISYKNVYYFNAILKEIQKDKSYDRIVISEELEAFSHTQYDQIDKFIFDKLDSISDEASNMRGNDTPIILICSDRRAKGEQMLVKLFGIGVYNAVLGNDRGIEEVCELIHRPRLKKEAKSYYKIDAEDVNYQAENENDVSEMEIQNILAHYKSLGKNEDRYIDSFNNIAAQYNDTQLRIISKFLPLNVRAVLEEKSTKYQQIMSFNNSVANSLRYDKKQEESGPSEKLLKPKTRNMPLSKPVVIPSAVNMGEAKKLSKSKSNKNTVAQTGGYQPEKKEQARFIQQKSEPKLQQQNVKQPTMFTNSQTVQRVPVRNEQTQKPVTQTSVKEENFEEIPMVVEEQVVPVKRGRGRPRKNAPVEPKTQVDTPKRGRGRPKKNVENEEQEMPILPGFENVEEDTILPGFENIDNEANVLPGVVDVEDEIVMPEVQDEAEAIVIPGLEENFDSEEPEIVMPGIKENNMAMPEIYDSDDDGISIDDLNNYRSSNNQNQTFNKPKDLYSSANINQQENVKKNNNYIPTKDLTRLMTADKKIVTFVGTSKNGTSFIVNNVAQLMSSMGIKTAILDATANRNSYYIYTKNEEELRNTAAYSLENLVQGISRGIDVNKNLTVFTSLADEKETINNVDDILETLLMNYSLILIDCDFNSPLGYFKQSNEIYLVQSLDVLTIQPLTAFLRELKGKNILDEKKLRIILNKTVRLRGITDKTIIGGMAFYNDPSMSFMTELFDRSLIKYISIPFDEEIYIRYLEAIVNCEVSLKGYSKTFMQVLKELGNMIYPLVSNQGGYRPPSVENRNAKFPQDMNNTLNEMKKRF